MKRVEKYIRRKSLITKSKTGFVDYAINHVLGCAHGCRYPCFAFLMKKRFGAVKTYEEWCKPALVENSLELLRREIPKHVGQTERIHLSFTTDPFMYGYKEIGEMSYQIISELNDAGISCSVLTKGVLPYELQNLSPNNDYGISVSSLDERFRKSYEPGAATMSERVAALKSLSDAGARTWVNIEPYPTPNIIEQDLGRILSAISFVDRISFGKMNYTKVVSRYPDYKNFYRERRAEVIAFCSEREIECSLKD